MFEYKKGKKGSPNQYKINTVNFTVQMTVQTTVQTTANMSNINRLDKDFYFNLLNKYKKQIREMPRKTIQIIGELKRSSDYELLTMEEQDRIFYDLMTPERKEC